MQNVIKRFVREDEGMEMLEWAIVGVVFAVALVGAWGALKTTLDGKIRGITF